MTLQECYQKMNGNYDDVKSRLPMDKLIDRFVIKFLSDDTMDLLRKSVEAGDIEESFRAAHTLKGVVANLAFTELQRAAEELTEQLRPRAAVADTALYEKVEKAYDLTIAAIKEYEATK